MIEDSILEGIINNERNSDNDIWITESCGKTLFQVNIEITMKNV